MPENQILVIPQGSGGGGGVSSFNGRTGTVVPQVSDYSAFYPQKPTKVNNPILVSNGTTAPWVITNTLGDDTAIPVLINNTTNEQVNMQPVITGSTITYIFSSAVNIAANVYRVAYIGMLIAAILSITVDSTIYTSDSTLITVDHS